MVDDYHDSAESMERLLALWGHEVQVAYDGPTALRAALDFAPDLVLLDIGLPQMDGYEVGRRMQTDLELQSVVRVAMTGYGQDEDRRRSAEAGFSHHLVKPVDPDTLRQIVAASPARNREAGRGA